MEESRPTKAATRDYRPFSRDPWTLWDTLFARRSHRKYVPSEMEPATAAGLDALLDLSCEARGVKRDTVIAVTDAGAVDALKKRANKGIAGKINIWMSRAPLTGLLVMNLPSGDVHALRPVELPGAAIVVEDAVLWLTERGLGTCWLAGISEREIIAEQGLARERAVPAVISIGKPALEAPRTTSYGGISYQMMSRRRKPLSRIACVEKASAPYTLARLETEEFSAVEGGVERLLELMRDKKACGAGVSAPIDLAVEACLESARVAPSGNNAQRWQFIVSRDSARRGQLAGLCAADGEGWKAAFVCCGSGGKLEKILMDKPFWALDVPIAMSHISLMAASMGYEPRVLIDGIDEPAIAGFVDLASGTRVLGVIALC